MLPSYFDVHTHLNLKNFKNREEEMIKESLKENVWMINVGTDIHSTEKAVVLAKRYLQGVYATAGVHPIHASSFLSVKEEIERFVDEEKVVAVGECGLDYFHISDPENIKIQREVFVDHIHIANKKSKPLMLHLRNGSGGDAYDEAFQLIKEHSQVAGNLHFFAGTKKDARNFLSAGFTLSFTGVITFVEDFADLVRFPSLDMIMAETDAPFVAPRSIRGKENNPLYVKEVADKIAEIRPEKRERVLEALVENACRVFGVCV